jgi:hypothetical protein
MSDAPAKFEPFMLRCLTYGEALQSMRHTGCAIRRQHWCNPVLVYEGTRLVLDDEGDIRPWKPTGEDRRAVDWEMVAREAQPQ